MDSLEKLQRFRELSNQYEAFWNPFMMHKY